MNTQADGQRVTTQRTSKGIKLATMISWLLMLTGILVMACADAGPGRSTGFLISLASMPVWIAAKISKYWHHD